jgi:ankyrin repeat protein
MECNYMDRLRKIAPLLSDKEILDSVVANTQNAADMGKTMQNEGASNLGIFNQPEVQAPSAQDLSQFMVPEAPTAQDFAQFMEPQAPTAQDFAQFMEPQAPTAQDFAQFMKPMEPVHKPTAPDISSFMEHLEKSAAKEPSINLSLEIKEAIDKLARLKRLNARQNQISFARGESSADKEHSIKLRLELKEAKKELARLKAINERIPSEQPTAQDSAQSIELKNKLLLDLVKKVQYDNIFNSNRRDNRATVSEVNEVRNLLNSGANPNIKDEYGDPLLHISVTHSLHKENHEIVKLLLKAGAKPNMYADDGNTILGSVQPTDVKTFKLLLESGANPNLPSMNYDGSVRKYPIHTVLGDDYDAPYFNLYNNRLEFKEKKLETLRLLLQYGADPTNKDSDGRNALEYARYEYDTYGPEYGHFLEEVELIEEYIERMNRKKIGKVSVKEGRVFTQAGLGRRRSRKKKKSKNKNKKGGKRSNKKGGKTLKKKKRK